MGLDTLFPSFRRNSRPFPDIPFVPTTLLSYGSEPVPLLLACGCCCRYPTPIPSVNRDSDTTETGDAGNRRADLPVPMFIHGGVTKAEKLWVVGVERRQPLVFMFRFFSCSCGHDWSLVFSIGGLCPFCTLTNSKVFVSTQRVFHDTRARIGNEGLRNRVI